MRFNSREALERFAEVFDFMSGETGVIVRDRTIINIVPKGERYWVKVRFKNYTLSWFPSFEELYYILRGLAKCERYAYNGVEQSGAHKLFDFINDSIWGDYCYEELVEKYKLPLKGDPAFFEITNTEKAHANRG